MRRDVWLDENDQRQPTATGFVLTIIVVALVVLLTGVALGLCGIPLHAL